MRLGRYRDFLTAGSELGGNPAPTHVSDVNRLGAWLSTVPSPEQHLGCDAVNLGALSLSGAWTQVPGSCRGKYEDTDCKELGFD